MLQLQAGLMVQLSTAAMASGQVPGVGEVGEEGKRVLEGYSKFFVVSAVSIDGGSKVMLADDSLRIASCTSTPERSRLISAGVIC